MAKQFILPPIERLETFKSGEKRRGEQVLRVYEKKEIDDFIKKVGPLEREDFSYIIDWIFLINKEDNYGLAYRIGMKNNFISPTGHLATLAIHFGEPLATEGFPITDEILDLQYKKLTDIVRATTMKAQCLYENFISLSLHPTQWMMDELDDTIRRNNEAHRNGFRKG